MKAGAEVKPARERILDAAAVVMREKGLANTTTKLIAAAAGYSEAMIYKSFADKQELFLVVMKERLPPIRPQVKSAGTGDLAENIAGIVEQFLDFYVELYPMTASLFGSPELLAQQREGVKRSGGWGPAGPIRILKTHLDAERDVGRIRADADTLAAAQLLVGATFHQAFLATYDAQTSIANSAELAAVLVRSVLPALISGP